MSYGIYWQWLFKSKYLIPRIFSKRSEILYECIPENIIVGSSNGLALIRYQAMALTTDNQYLESYVVSRPVGCINLLWPIDIWDLNKLQWILSQNTIIFIEEDAFENVCKWHQFLFSPQCVNLLMPLMRAYIINKTYSWWPSAGLHKVIICPKDFWGRILIPYSKTVDSLSPGRYGCEFWWVNFEHNFGIDILSIQINITLEWMPEDLIDGSYHWFR